MYFTNSYGIKAIVVICFFVVGYLFLCFSFYNKLRTAVNTGGLPLFNPGGRTTV